MNTKDRHGRWQDRPGTGYYCWETSEDGLMEFSTKAAAVRSAEREGKHNIPIYSPTGKVVAVVKRESAS